MGKELTQVECLSEEFGFSPNGNGEPQKGCKQKSALSKFTVSTLTHVDVVGRRGGCGVPVRVTRPAPYNRCLPRACCLPGSTGRAENTAGSKVDHVPCLQEVYVGERGKWTGKKVNIKSGSS